jgi:hypothetical protein
MGDGRSSGRIMHNLRLLVCDAKLDQILILFAELCAIVLRKGDVLVLLDW